MTTEERNALFHRERMAYCVAQALIRNACKMPELTKKEVDFHMEACAAYLDAGYPYDGERTPFVVGFRAKEG